MRSFKSANTTFKILSLVAVLLIFLSAISLAGYSAHSKTRKKLTNLQHNYVTPAVSALDAKVIATENRHLLFALSHNSLEENSEIVKRIRENRKKIEVLSSIYMSGNLPEAERRCAIELKKLREDVFEKQEEVFAAIEARTDNGEIGRRLLEGGDIDRLEDAYLATADKFTKLLVRMADHDIDRTAQVARVGAMRIAIISLSAIAFGIVFAVLISHSITSPLGKLRRAISAFSRGSFDCEIESSGSDEIAQMGRHLMEMADNLQRVVVSAKRASRDMSGMAREFSVLVKETNASADELQFNADDMGVCLSAVAALGMEIYGMLDERGGKTKEVSEALREMLERANEAARSGERIRRNVLETAAVSEYLSKGSEDIFRFSCDLERMLAFFKTEDTRSGHLVARSAEEMVSVVFSR